LKSALIAPNKTRPSQPFRDSTTLSHA
jgi:hypothetical protein